MMLQSTFSGAVAAQLLRVGEILYTPMHWHQLCGKFESNLELLEVETFGMPSLTMNIWK